MEAEQLADWLQKGHGRAVLALRECDATVCRATILNACHFDQRYDRQVEDSRGRYFFDVIQATGEPEFYRDAVLAALATPAEGDDQDQLFDITRFFAQAGDAAARSAMYAAFERNALTGDLTGADELVELDGLDGFLFAVAHLPGIEYSEDEWLLGWWIGELEDRYGKDAVWSALDHAAETDPRLGNLLVREREERRETEENRAQRNALPRRADMTYVELRALIQSSGSRTSRVRLSRWGERASEEDLLAAAQDLLAEQDGERLLIYLRLFTRRAFPLDPSRLIGLTFVTDDDAAWEALRALAPIRHPDVRARALELLSHGLFAPEAVGILASNYEAVDERLVERTLETAPQNKDLLHRLGIRARDFIDAHPDVSKGILRLVYDITPCSMCRESVVATMVEAGGLPNSIREECRWDASEGTRKLAAAAMGGAET